MRYLALLLAGTALFGCSWDTYQKNDGHTRLRQKAATQAEVERG